MWPCMTMYECRAFRWGAGGHVIQAPASFLVTRTVRLRRVTPCVAVRRSCLAPVSHRVWPGCGWRVACCTSHTSDDGYIYYSGVSVMVPRCGGNLLLHGRTTHPAVLINTNGWHGYGELKSKIIKRVLDATNFVTRLRSPLRGGGGSVHTTKASIAPQGLQRSLDNFACREISLRPFRQV